MEGKVKEGCINILVGIGEFFLQMLVSISEVRLSWLANKKRFVHREHPSQRPNDIIEVVHNYRDKTLFEESGWYEVPLKNIGRVKTSFIVHNIEKTIISFYLVLMGLNKLDMRVNKYDSMKKYAKFGKDGCPNNSCQIR